jgi:hypothetical protein
MKPGVNFANISRVAFLCEIFEQSFFCLDFKFELYLAQEYWRKCAHKNVGEIDPSSNVNETSNYQIPTIDVTALRKDPDYAIYYHNWARLAVLGIVPFVMLVYFNTKIYNDLQVKSFSILQS